MYDLSLFNFTVGKHKDRPLYVPVNCLILIRVLEEKGFSTEFFDYKLNDFKNETDIDNIVKFFKQAKSDIICISSMSQGLPFLVLALRKIKRECPEKIFVLGGVGPTSGGKALMEFCKEIDFIVMHEAETTLPELITSIKAKGDFKKIKGIVFRHNNQVIMTERREREENIDIIPAFHKINFKHYNKMPIMTSRGCPYNCSFCYNKPFWGPKITLRSIKNVFDEIDIIKDHFDFVPIYDDLFISNRKRVNEFLDIYKKGKYSFEWGFFGRINLMNKEFMEKTSKSNCTGAFYGLESGSDRILKEIDKKITYKQIIKVLSLTDKYYSRSDASMIYGWPSETWDEFMKTIKLFRFCDKTKNIHPVLTQLTPLYGTKVYYENRDKLFLSDSPLPRFTSSAVELKPEHIELIKSNKDLFSCYYQVPSIALEQKQQYLYLIKDESKDNFIEIKDVEK